MDQVIATPPNPFTGLITHDGKVYKKREVDGLITFELAPIPEMKPLTRFTGQRMKLDTLWYPVCAFFEWTQKEFGSESVVRLFYNKAIGEWKPWAFPQEISGGMSAKELEDDPAFAEQDQAIGPGFDLYGTAHHHCKFTAFQSGTDHRDEAGGGGVSRWNGIHITVGKIGSDEYDWHARLITNHIQSEVVIEDWFDLPNELLSLFSPKMRGEAAKHILCNPPPDVVGFPEIWKTNMKRRTFTQGNFPGGVGYHQHMNHAGPVGKVGNGSSGNAGGNGGSTPGKQETVEHIAGARASSKNSTHEKKVYGKKHKQVGNDSYTGLTQQELQETFFLSDFEEICKKRKWPMIEGAEYIVEEFYDSLPIMWTTMSNKELEESMDQAHIQAAQEMGAERYNVD